MGKDFRVGLIAGGVLAGAALIWVATRPSLSPRARLAPAGAALPKIEQPTEGTTPWQNIDTPEPAPVNSPAPAELTATASQEPTQPLGVVEQAQPVQPTQQTVASSEQPAQAVNRDLTIHEQAEPIKTTRFHIVRKNETLSAISQQYYGSQEKWRKIVAANSKTIKDPNKIAPGTKLIIPE